MIAMPCSESPLSGGGFEVKQLTFSMTNTFEIPQMKASVQVSHVHYHVNILSCWECSLVALYYARHAKNYLWYPSFSPFKDSRMNECGFRAAQLVYLPALAPFKSVSDESVDTAAIFVDQEKPSYKLKCSTKA